MKLCNIRMNKLGETYTYHDCCTTLPFNIIFFAAEHSKYSKYFDTLELQPHDLFEVHDYSVRLLAVLVYFYKALITKVYFFGTSERFHIFCAHHAVFSKRFLQRCPKLEKGL